MSPSYTAPLSTYVQYRQWYTIPKKLFFVSFLGMGPVLSFVNSTHLLQAALLGIEADEGSKEGGLCHRNYALTSI